MSETETFDALPETPLTNELVEKLRESDGIEFVRGLMWMSGTMVGLDTNDVEVTEDVILSTESKTVVLWYSDGVGWVVEKEIEHDPDDDPREVGFEAWAEASNAAAEGFHEAFGGDQHD